MAESLATVLVLAALRGRQHEGAVLDRAGAIKHVPMCFAGLLGEGRGDGEKRTSGLGERAIKRGEAQIVADRESESSPRQVGRHADFTRPIVARLAITLAAAEFDVEHVNLVIARDDVALAVDQERTVRRLFGQQLDGERADMQEDAELARKLA